MGDSPKHLAVILDGNRRYAKRLGIKPWEGHKVGFDKLNDFFNWCYDLGITELTLYALSMQNLERDKVELEFLYGIFERACDEVLKSEDVKNREVKVSFLGNRHLLPKSLQKKMLEVEAETSHYKKLKLNIAMAYGGREEIVEAVKKIAIKVMEGELDPGKIDIKLLNDNLWLTTEPDLVIRPGGEMRMSNFFPWQTIYSEWFFIDKLWPEFEKEDLERIIAEYVKREKRRGK